MKPFYIELYICDSEVLLTIGLVAIVILSIIDVYTILYVILFQMIVSNVIFITIRYN